MLKKRWLERLWDAWCVVSILGIWPRYIEPKLLGISSLTLPIPALPASLEGFKILHFSDLHWKAGYSKKLQSKILSHLHAFKPDLVVFTGDLICRSKLEQKESLIYFLSKFDAPCGCFAVLGNHDYEKFVTVNSAGDYAIDEKSPSTIIGKGFRRLFSKVSLTGFVQPDVPRLEPHPELLKLLEQTSFRLLLNQTETIMFKDACLNVTGLEEYSLGRANLKEAFRHYQTGQMGIILVHNPDLIKKLETFPGELILAGHTHGGQVNLPFIWKKFTKIENLEFKRGLKNFQSKWAYINRGISAVLPFRWFSLPELTLLKLKRA